MQTAAMRPHLGNASSCLKKNASSRHSVLLAHGGFQTASASSSHRPAAAGSSPFRSGFPRLYASEASARHSSSKLEQTVQSTKGSLEKRTAQQDRHSIDRQSDETSKSGTDDAVAAQSTLSFDPQQSKHLDPEQSRKKSGQENAWGNPLDASPANREFSEGTVEVQSGGTRGKGGGGFGGEKEEVTYKQRTYRSESTMKKKAEAGFEKKAFAGSSKTVEDKERPPMIRPGSR